jgi:hypothetical protein
METEEKLNEQAAANEVLNKNMKALELKIF